MNNFFRDNWKVFLAILVVLSLLILAYVFILASPTEDHRDGNGSIVPYSAPLGNERSLNG